jgi:hypothetical protein
MVYSDKAVRAHTSGRLARIAGRRRPEKVDRLEKQFFEGKVTEDALFATGRGVAPWMASVTFGGPDLADCLCRSLKGDRIPYFRAPVPGLPMVHWKSELR